VGVAIATILLLVLLVGAFAGALVAILAVPRPRIAELVEEGRRSARHLVRLRDNQEVLVSTIEVSISLLATTAAVIGGVSVTDALAPYLVRFPGIGPYTEKVALVLVVLLVSFLSLVLAELVPKSLALRAAEPYALFVATPVWWLAKILHPFVVTLTWASNVILRAFGDRTTFIETRVSPEEIQQMVEEAATTGTVDPQVGEIASRALDLSKLDAYTVMVPRADIAMIPKQIRAREIAGLAREKGYARMPVYDGSRDNIVGLVNLREALADAVLEEVLDLERLLHPIVYVPDTISAPSLLRRMQEEKTHLVLVVNEQGTLVGLVTIEDLVEELVGDILNENDREPAKVIEESDGVWRVAGDVPLHEIARELGRELPASASATLAGLVMELAGAVPQPGTVIEDGGIRFEVLESTPRRVRWVRLRPIDATEEERSTMPT
jgi:putative hemolysin